VGSLSRRTSKLKAKFDKLVLKYQFKKAEFNECKIIMEEAMEQFGVCFERGASKLTEEEYAKLKSNVQAQEIKDHKAGYERAKRQKKKDEDNAESEPDSELKSLYREIAKETHPDKLLESDERAVKEKTKLFQEAYDAVDSKDWFKLREIASDLGIDSPEPSEKQIKLLEISIKEVGAKIKSAHKTVAWNWFHFETEEMKEDYMEQYIMSFLK
jgi:hypothetical protein